MISAGGVVVTPGMAAAVAESAGVCVRPHLRQVTDRATGEVTSIPIPCGSTRESKCKACATKAKRLRMHQCREGWHLTDDPIKPTDDDQADDVHDQADDEGHGEGAVDDRELLAGEELTRRARSTRRARDAPDLPRVAMDGRTTGQAFTDPRTGRTYRPSMFVTLTLDSYGPIVPGRGVPVTPATYDYRRAALDALHFPKVVDRWVQNLRRCAGFKAQYFAAVEPQKRLAPHLHAAIRGSIPRATIKAVTAATYVNVWWPQHDEPVYGAADRAPSWDRDGRYRCPETGDPLQTWESALADLDAQIVADPTMRPAHTVRLGRQVDVKGLLGGTPDSDRAVRYLCKYLTKNVSETYTSADPEHYDAAYEAHIDRLHAEVLVLPCSPECANWLRYGIQPKNAGPGMVPGRCSRKAHDRECLGLGGRRCLVSRAWTGKTLTAHKADRAEVVRQVLEAAGIEPPEARRAAADVLHTDGKPRYVWADVPLAERDYTAVIVGAINEAHRWRAQHEHAKTLAAQRGAPPSDGPGGPVDNCSARRIGVGGGVKGDG